MFAPPTPDPGYLDPLDDYFTQNHSHPFSGADSQSESDLNTEDDDDHPDERRHFGIPENNPG
jgi:hypothetical protein